MKKIIGLLFFLIIISATPLSSKAAAENLKVGVMFSEPNESYANAIHPGGSYKPANWPYAQTVSEKNDFSSILDKELKMYHFYLQQGYNVEKISHNALNNLKTLHQYDVIVFPYTVLMNNTQRENLKTYIYGGGGVQFLFGTARNELNHYPSAGKMDLSPLIYDTLTYIWEWDNLTEVFHSQFITDLALKNATITNSTVTTHPILTEAYKILGRNSIKLTENSSSGNWYEIVKPWNNSINPLLVYTDYTYASQPNNIAKKNTGALFALEHGQGKVVFSTFKIFDYLLVNADADWEDHTEGKAFSTTSNHEDAAAILKASLDWLGEKSSNFVQRKYDLSLSYSNLTGNVTPQNKFAVRGSVTVKNTGNVPARGKIKVEVLNTNNQSLGSYTKTILGLSPSNTKEQSYTEKFEILLPGTLGNGNYNLKTTFEETRHDKTGFITRAENYIMKKSGNYGSFSQFKMFSDVSKSNDHYNNISNAAKIGIISGYSDNTFKPFANVSRLHAMMMLLKALNIPVSKIAALSVSDLKKGQYGYDVMATAYQRGFINVENGKINHNEPMRRGVMAQSLVKGFNLQGKSLMPFTDISPNYEQYKNIEILYHHRITTGTTPTTYSPYSPVTRQQFTTFIMQALNNSSK